MVDVGSNPAGSKSPALTRVVESARTLNVGWVGSVLTVAMGVETVGESLTSLAFQELGDLFDAVSLDDEVHAVVLTGAGKRFSTGGNVRAMADRAETGERQLSRSSAIAFVGRMYRNLLAVDQPIIACVNGDAIGAGATLALHCDIVVAAEGARLGDPHVKRGLVASAGPYVWSQMASLNVAKEYLLLGDAMDVSEGYRLGLINHVYPPDELWDRAMDLAERLAALPPHAVRWTKRLLNRPLVERMVETLDQGVGYELVTFGTEDHKEGVAAFLERRTPVFRGH
jgi:enoyl-CoA hydratase